MKKLLFISLAAFVLSSCNGGKTEDTEAVAVDSTAVQVDSLSVSDSTVVDSIK